MGSANLLLREPVMRAALAVRAAAVCPFPRWSWLAAVVAVAAECEAVWVAAASEAAVTLASHII